MTVGVQPHPVTVLFISPFEMAHPVTQRLKSVRGQLFPNRRNLTIKKCASNLVQLTAHTHLTGQGLERRKYNSQDTLICYFHMLFFFFPFFIPSEAQPVNAASGPPVY